MPPLWAPGIGPHCDCPQLLQAAGRAWLLYLQRNTRYRVASAFTGPFDRPERRNLGTMLAAAGSRPAFDGRRWISFPFLAGLTDNNDAGAMAYGGPLCIPRHLTFHTHSEITEAPVEEILHTLHGQPDPGDPLAGAQVLSGAWSLSSRSAACLVSDGGTFLPAMMASRDGIQWESTAVLQGGMGQHSIHLLFRVRRLPSNARGSGYGSCNRAPSAGGLVASRCQRPLTSQRCARAPRGMRQCGYSAGPPAARPGAGMDIRRTTATHARRRVRTTPASAASVGRGILRQTTTPRCRAAPALPPPPPWQSAAWVRVQRRTTRRYPRPVHNRKRMSSTDSGSLPAPSMISRLLVISPATPPAPRAA